jgi:hypothetical protein
LSGGNNTDITAIWPDQADFRDADALIDSKLCSADKLSPIAKQLTSPRLVFWRADNTMKTWESSTKIDRKRSVSSVAHGLDLFYNSSALLAIFFSSSLGK